MKIELWHARGLRIAINGVETAEKHWKVGQEDSTISVATILGNSLPFASSPGATLLLKSIDLGVPLNGLTTEMVETAEVTFMNPEANSEMQLVLPLVKEVTGTFVTTVAGKREDISECTLYQLFDDSGEMPPPDLSEDEAPKEWTITLRMSGKSYKEVERMVNDLEPLEYKIVESDGK